MLPKILNKNVSSFFNRIAPLKRVSQRKPTFRISPFIVFGILLLGTGCASPIALHRAVLEYDRAVNRVELELLLLNIARTSHGEPIHFTAISSIAATFDFTVNSGLAGSIVENPGLDTLSLNFGSSASENPTIYIIPIQGEDFTKRLLTPMNDTTLAFLIRQGLEPALIIRLMARGIFLNGYGESCFLLNMPHRKEEFEEFRRRVLHLSALNYARQLHVGQIMFEDESGQHAGRVAITNYNLEELSNEERKQLHAEAQKYPSNHVLVDIHPDFPGGSYPLHGMIKLRSFRAILGFLGRSISYDPEFYVEKDPRTGEVQRNPTKTLNILISESAPRNASLSVNHNGLWYWIQKPADRDSGLPDWDHQAFDILYQMFQVTVTDVTQVQVPTITIAK